MSNMNPLAPGVELKPIETIHTCNGCGGANAWLTYDSGVEHWCSHKCYYETKKKTDMRSNQEYEVLLKGVEDAHAAWDKVAHNRGQNDVPVEAEKLEKLTIACYKASAYLKSRQVAKAKSQQQKELCLTCIMALYPLRKERSIWDTDKWVDGRRCDRCVRAVQVYRRKQSPQDAIEKMRTWDCPGCNSEVMVGASCLICNTKQEVEEDRKCEKCNSTIKPEDTQCIICGAVPNLNTSGH